MKYAVLTIMGALLCLGAASSATAVTDTPDRDAFAPVLKTELAQAQASLSNIVDTVETARRDPLGSPGILTNAAAKLRQLATDRLGETSPLGRRLASCIDDRQACRDAARAKAVDPTLSEYLSDMYKKLDDVATAQLGTLLQTKLSLHDVRSALDRQARKLEDIETLADHVRSHRELFKDAILAGVQAKLASELVGQVKSVLDGPLMELPARQQKQFATEYTASPQ